MASKPSISPRYAHAAKVFSANRPMIRPRPFEHSKINAAEHMSVNISLIYEPSDTQTREPSRIAATRKSKLPEISRLSHSHSPPHSRRTSQSVSGGGGFGGIAARDNTLNVPGLSSETVQAVPHWILSSCIS